MAMVMLCERVARKQQRATNLEQTVVNSMLGHSGGSFCEL